MDYSQGKDNFFRLHNSFSTILFTQLDEVLVRTAEMKFSRARRTQTIEILVLLFNAGKYSYGVYSIQVRGMLESSRRDTRAVSSVFVPNDVNTYVMYRYNSL